MPLGRPITLSSNVASKSLSITATAGQTVFLPSGGYRINEIAVYKEGVRLVDGTDFTARDGASVILTSGASLNDVLEFQIFDSFNIANTIKPNESTQTITGSLVVEGGITGSVLGIQSGGTAIGTGRTVNFIGTGNTVVDNGDGIINVSISGETAGIDTSTTSEFTDISVSGVATVGSAVTINSTGIDAVSGVITAANFVGGGANLTALNGTNIASGTVAAARVATLNQNTSGTAANLSGTPDITINNITGVAATFTGVLTYEDVTNVDSVGIVTARSGIEFGAAGVGGTVTALGHAEFVGIVTASGLDAAIAFWTLGASGTDHYTFTGPGDLSGDTDPDLQLIRGQKYIFKNRSGGHPFRIQSTVNGSAGTAYNDGVTNNDAGNGTDLVFDVPYDAPPILYYQCTSHNNMGGAIYVGSSSGDNVILSGIATVGTALSLADNVHARFGNSGDLKIYHDSGGQSRIEESGSSVLKIMGSDLRLSNTSNSADYVQANDGAAVNIYFNGSKKLETTNTGVEVTGTATATEFVGGGSGLTGISVPAGFTELDAALFN